LLPLRLRACGWWSGCVTGHLQLALFEEQLTCQAKPLDPLLQQGRRGNQLGLGLKFARSGGFVGFVGNQWQLAGGSRHELPQLGALVFLALLRHLPIERPGKGAEQQQGKAAALPHEPAFEPQRIRVQRAGSQGRRPFQSDWLGLRRR